MARDVIANHDGRITVPIEGMTCASCVSHVEKALQGVRGVEGVSVNLATERAALEIGSAGIPLDEVRRAVAAVAFAVAPSATAARAAAGQGLCNTLGGQAVSHSLARSSASLTMTSASYKRSPRDSRAVGSNFPALSHRRSVASETPSIRAASEILISLFIFTSLP